jgi:hypothetical protein
MLWAFESDQWCLTDRSGKGARDVLWVTRAARTFIPRWKCGGQSRVKVWCGLERELTSVALEMSRKESLDNQISPFNFDVSLILRQRDCQLLRKTDGREVISNVNF